MLSLNIRSLNYCAIKCSSTLENLPDLENVMTHFYLNFLKSRKLEQVAIP